jgi:hypothetical protein
MLPTGDDFADQCNPSNVLDAMPCQLFDAETILSQSEE